MELLLKCLLLINMSAVAQMPFLVTCSPLATLTDSLDRGVTGSTRWVTTAAFMKVWVEPMSTSATSVLPLT
jgi:hypothetical protein